ncbi:subtilisin-like protease [Triticum dicoccoides]|uniref:subtilisin-like protease n=1 Tax=Triticum dicoccoides TaxID=85692 RepID=UPI000E7C1F81|nr:subtilisin-like protease [Triticum dicoccoides]XP_037462573.1 subtilisin-like protease [Triticum dicoccoides]XP_037462578.1 subtilisin-like protease [Triticum dicoccoides]XP_037462582.1 subtilisin-like protease [Triticum dicoccoides]XP_037462588.1 subtilisin-like protease [Triticum dicoccoides]XP_037462591.1 subtilisin-like protease [Triticum dicoccoides]XP_037462596.1 subtilisin-like protease [Triticum dicoccoides]XP_037462602.1 subtilisin-like protease [Triticum dicoccoides]XP_03746260
MFSTQHLTLRPKAIAVLVLCPPFFLSQNQEKRKKHFLLSTVLTPPPPPPPRERGRSICSSPPCFHHHQRERERGRSICSSAPCYHHQQPGRPLYLSLPSITTTSAQAMASLANLLISLFSLNLMLLHAPAPAVCDDLGAGLSPNHSTYIVLLRPPVDAGSDEDHRWWQDSFLPTPLAGSDEPRLIHTYTNVFTGFAARLTEAELALVSKRAEFVRAFPNQLWRPTTTHTQEFLGLKRDAGLWRDTNYGKGVIIGVVDTGIYAAHPSFDDNGIPPPPSKWKGSCHGTAAAHCNNKLIGAKFITVNDSGDVIGHGTHTSSTAAGNFVSGASAQGLGRGTAAGTAPRAHLAMYSMCTLRGCDSADIVAGIDEAIKDGVDVLSLSLAPVFDVEFSRDPVVIGALSAVAKGIVVVAAAGNNGPEFFIANSAPWLLTVAAGSVDRSFETVVQLGNGNHINGEAFNQVSNSSSKPKPFPLYLDKHCKSSPGRNVAGKIVICHSTGPMNDTGPSINKFDICGIMSAGAAGVVLINRKAAGFTTLLEDYGNVVQVTVADGNNIIEYVRTTSKASAKVIYKNTVLGVRPSPTVAAFSSRGPSTFSPGVLKPDILAPGLNVIAAWPPLTMLGSGPFHIKSGTSMSTPHVSGVAALIKSSHPDWSAAATKSAILTTADITDSTGGPILDEQHQRATAYAMGAGHVNPTKAIDPGLVYDLGITEYAGYICALLGDKGLAVIARDPMLSCKMLPKIPEAQLNYPTITVPLKKKPFTVNRTVTNVGPENSIYTLKMEVPKSLTVRVYPETLMFSKAGEKITYSMTVSRHRNGREKSLEGSISWVSSKHVVRSPIVAVAGLVSPLL